MDLASKCGMPGYGCCTWEVKHKAAVHIPPASLSPRCGAAASTLGALGRHQELSTGVNLMWCPAFHGVKPHSHAPCNGVQAGRRPEAAVYSLGIQPDKPPSGRHKHSSALQNCNRHQGNAETLFSLAPGSKLKR